MRAAEGDCPFDLAAVAFCVVGCCHVEGGLLLGVGLVDWVGGWIDCVDVCLSLRDG